MTPASHASARIAPGGAFCTTLLTLVPGMPGIRGQRLGSSGSPPAWHASACIAPGHALAVQQTRPHCKPGARRHVKPAAVRQPQGRKLGKLQASHHDCQGLMHNVTLWTFIGCHIIIIFIIPSGCHHEHLHKLMPGCAGTCVRRIVVGAGRVAGGLVRVRGEVEGRQREGGERRRLRHVEAGEVIGGGVDRAVPCSTL